MNVTVRGYRPHDAAVIALPEQVDCAAVHALGRQADGARLAGRRLIAIDLRAVSFIDTRTLSELCAVLRHVPGSGARCAVVGADPRVQSVLQLCEIDGLTLHRTIRAAQRHRPSALAPLARLAWRGLLARSPHDHPRTRGPAAGSDGSGAGSSMVEDTRSGMRSRS